MISKNDPILLDIFPLKGSFSGGELAIFRLIVDTEVQQERSFMIKIFNGPHALDEQIETHHLHPGINELTISWRTPNDDPAGYGIEISLEGSTQTIESAFDVLNEWIKLPRYGFLCDFFPERDDPDETMEILTKFHINGLQFYDWQYRHDDLMPRRDEYVDPLGRMLSLPRVRQLIDSAHAHGIAAMPYLTIYAASVQFWKDHPEWELLDRDSKPIPFGENFLGIMNPTKNGPWAKHLLNECRTILSELPFDGLHIDQFGEPKVAFDTLMRKVDLPTAFSDFVSSAKAEHPKSPVVFNAVGNWPIETLAISETALDYIEVWPPDTKYLDVVRIVRNAKQISGGKAVVIALYISAKYPINNLLVNALVLSAGGTRIELGENGRLLTDPYFPNHEPMSEWLTAQLRKQNDLLVRYEEWFGPLVNEDRETQIETPEGIAAFYRRSGHKASLSLVNLTGGKELAWNEDTPMPRTLNDLQVSIEEPNQPKQILWINMNGSTLNPLPLEHCINDGKLTLVIPALSLWTLVLIEF